LGCNVDIAEALKWYKRAADANFIPGIEAYAKAVQDQMGGEQYYRGLDKSEAVYYYKKGSISENCMFWYADMLERGDGIPQNLPAARELFRQCGEKGLMAAKCKYAEMLIQGKGGPTNVSEAKNLLEQAGRKGFAAAWSSLGLMALMGRHGIAQNRDQAFQYFQEAVLGGDVVGMVWFTSIILDPDRGRPDLYAEARSVLARLSVDGKASNEQKAYAELKLAEMLDTGKGGPVDKAAAHAYARRAARKPGTRYTDKAVLLLARLCLEADGYDADIPGAKALLRGLVERRVDGGEELLRRFP
jgi:TPR repeat protein